MLDRNVEHRVAEALAAGHHPSTDDTAALLAAIRVWRRTAIYLATGHVAYAENLLRRAAPPKSSLHGVSAVLAACHDSLLGRPDHLPQADQDHQILALKCRALHDEIQERLAARRRGQKLSAGATGE